MVQNYKFKTRMRLLLRESIELFDLKCSYKKTIYLVIKYVGKTNIENKIMRLS